MKLSCLAKGLLGMLCILVFAFALSKANNGAYIARAVNTFVSTDEDVSLIKYHNSLEYIKVTKTVRIGTISPNPPLYHFKPPYFHTGFEYELAKLIFSQPEFIGDTGVVNVLPKFRNKDNTRTILGMLKETNERRHPTIELIMAGVTETSIPRHDEIYSEAYLKNRHYSVVTTMWNLPKYKDNVDAIKNNKAIRIGVLTSDVLIKQYIVDHFPGAIIVEYNDENTFWMSGALASGKVDIVIANDYNAYDETNFANIVVAIHELPYSHSEFHMVFRSKDHELRDEVNKVLPRVMASRPYKELLLKYNLAN